MQFRFIRQIDGEAPVYGGQFAKTGDIIELEGHLADKASRNPHFEAVTDGGAKKAPAKRSTRKKAVTDGDSGSTEE